MDTNKFVKAIQTLIKEEVRKQVAKEKLAIRESIIQEMSTPQPKKKVKKPNVKFKQGKFSEMLNETVDNWPTMGGGTLTANSAQGMDRATMASMMGLSSSPTPQSMIPTQDSDGRPVDVNAVMNSSVGQALTKDYSGLMKAIDKKKGRV
tara:strand:+ start:82 stop:528 length:447 start_codon:yes stop_codon:yes gene_type:complete